MISMPHQRRKKRGRCRAGYENSVGRRRFDLDFEEEFDDEMPLIIRSRSILLAMDRSSILLDDDFFKCFLFLLLSFILLICLLCDNFCTKLAMKMIPFVLFSKCFCFGISKAFIRRSDCIF